jgi:stage V sporulation protein D (sporulation-specific penicillin-binding protein)
MASYPNYDSNQYGMILDTTLQEKLDAKLGEIEKNRGSYDSEEAYEAAVAAAKSNAVNTSWRNKCIDSTYEPGSTFKPITLAAVLEEGLVNMNTTFNCTGSVKVGKWTIGCSKKAGHGIQDLKTATGNSCNPAFIKIGQMVGPSDFRNYYKGFGFSEITGIFFYLF